MEENQFVDVVWQPSLFSSQLVLFCPLQIFWNFLERPKAQQILGTCLQ